MSTQALREIPFYRWDVKYAVGVEVIDAQHQQIFTDIPTLISLLDTKPSLSEIEAVVDDMIDYVGHHFKTEEQFLRKHPEFLAHQAKHQAFSERTMEFDRQLFAAKPEEMALDLFLFLGSWLQKHILTEDQAYFDYLRRNSLLPALA